MPRTYEALTKAGVPLFAYGNFITVLINFLILAFIIFQMVRLFNRAQRLVIAEKPAAAPAAAAGRRRAAAGNPGLAEAPGLNPRGTSPRYTGFGSSMNTASMPKRSARCRPRAWMP